MVSLVKKVFNVYVSKDKTTVNLVVFAEVSSAFLCYEHAIFFEKLGLVLFDIPYKAAYLAGRVHMEYCQCGGNRARALPDFFIGAHAQVANMRILTCDTYGYRTYFPKVKLIAPDNF